MMRISGIVVAVDPLHFESVAASLAEFEGVDVHQRDRDSSRIIVTQDAATEKEHERTLECIQALAHVRYAQLVYHYVETEEAAPEDHT